MNDDNSKNLENLQQSSVGQTSFVSKNLNSLVIFIIILIIGCAIGFKFYRPYSEKPLSGTSQNLENTPTTESKYQSNTENITFIIPKGWIINSSANFSLPLGFKDSVFVLQKKGSACTIVGVNRDSTPHETRKQISFADRVLSNYTQFDSSWYLSGSSTQYLFSNNERQYLPSEFRMSVGLRNNHFILFMTDNSSVPDDCNNDLNSLLATVEPYYEKVQLSSSSTGIITVEKVWDDVTPSSSNKSYEHLIFIDDGSKEKREVMKIPNDTWTGQFFVLGSKLYISSNTYQFNNVDKRPQFDSVLYTLDPFTGKTTQIIGTTKTDTYISSLYVQGGMVYYLAGTSSLGTCLDGYGPCASDLFSIPLTGGNPSMIAHSTLGGQIIGYVESERAIYIGQGWGDAGCGSTLINKIVDGKEESVGKFGECVGEDEVSKIAYKKMQEKITTITTKVRSSKLSSKGIRIQNMDLLPVDTEISGVATFYFEK